MNARQGQQADEKLLTVKDLAALLQVSEKWVYNAVDNKLVPVCRIGRFVRFRRQEIDAWLDGGSVPAGGAR